MTPEGGELPRLEINTTADEVLLVGSKTQTITIFNPNPFPLFVVTRDGETIITDRRPLPPWRSP